MKYSHIILQIGLMWVLEGMVMLQLLLGGLFKLSFALFIMNGPVGPFYFVGWLRHNYKTYLEILSF
jgi:hypothetical protein